MFARSSCLGWLLVVCAGLAGCTPMAEPPQDEQKNPFYRTAKERLESRDYKGAIEAFEKALQLNPNGVMSHFELALVLEQREFDYAGAIYHYNKVRKLRPNGYPGDNAKERIRVCKQELAKSQAMESLVPSLPLQFEKLREENEKLNGLVATQKVQIAVLQAQLTAARAAIPPTPQTGAGGTRSGNPPPGTGTTSGGAGGVPGGAGAGAGAVRNPVRTHRVRQRETFSSIARQYGVKLESLLAANPGIIPKRLRPGQILTIP